MSASTLHCTIAIIPCVLIPSIASPLYHLDMAANLPVWQDDAANPLFPSHPQRRQHLLVYSQLALLSGHVESDVDALFLSVAVASLQTTCVAKMLQTSVPSSGS
jgi:hypothetical protein